MDQDVLESSALAAAFVWTVWYADRRPWMRGLWSRFAAGSARFRPLARLTPERRLAIAGVSVVLASIGGLALVSGLAGRRSAGFMALCAPFLLAGALGGFAALYAGALALLSVAGLRR